MGTRIELDLAPELNISTEKMDYMYLPDQVEMVKAELDMMITIHPRVSV